MSAQIFALPTLASDGDRREIFEQQHGLMLAMDGNKIRALPALHRRQLQKSVQSQQDHTGPEAA